MWLQVYRLDPSELCGVLQEAAKRRINKREVGYEVFFRGTFCPAAVSLRRFGMLCCIALAFFVVNSGEFGYWACPLVL